MKPLRKKKTTTPFQEKVYSACRQIPRGRVSTYGELAKLLGIPSARAIGQALKSNPYAPEVPCHRIVRSDGKIGGFLGKTTPAVIAAKSSLLQNEGVLVCNNCVDLRKYGFLFGSVKV